MKTIQIDMFEVGLGAGILIQFRKNDRIVRILADAGLDRGYPKTHVLGKLPAVVRAFDNRMGPRDKIKIDLIIGTHYDADHLVGLVPIINDPLFEFGEAWLPPIANDEEGPDNFFSNADPILPLPLQFAGEEGDETFKRYMKAKYLKCKQVQHVRESLNQSPGENLRPFSSREEEHRFAGQAVPSAGDFENFGVDRIEHADHVPGDSMDPEFILHELEQSPFRGIADEILNGNEIRLQHDWFGIPNNRLGIHKFTKFNLNSIIEAEGKNAINADSLKELVDALKAKGVPIKCQVVDDGEPTTFIWESGSERFLAGAQNLTPRQQDIALQLLGPSKGLVRKHWKLLPIGTYMDFALRMNLPIKTITESNQLSYVLRMDFCKQRILVSGDAGCVDFKPARGDYYPKLIEALDELHVVQVAHHGGNNAHFYLCLQESGYTDQSARSYLLFSHAENDKYRPSEVFGDFAADLQEPGDDFKLLFTSRPKPEKVATFLDLIYPVTGGASAGKCDISMSYSTPENKWKIDRHGITFN